MDCGHHCVMNSKVVLITGCSSGFGKSLVTGFLQEGFTVVATMRDARKREALFDSERVKFQGRLFIEELDVTKASDRSAIASFLQDNLDGRLDVLINNAGYGLFGVFEELSESSIRDQMEVNFFGVIELTKLLLPALRAQKGIIFNLSSIMGLIAPPISSLYCASKFAIEGWSESLHYELAPHSVRVIIIEPGSFRTQFGKNIIQGNLKGLKNSPYEIQTKRHGDFRQNLMTRKSGNPAIIVERVLAITRSNRSPIRVLCGADAKAMRFLQKLLPEVLWNALMRISYRNLFS